jgi:RNA polymerase sigma-70 factor (ECF subfamily)
LTASRAERQYLELVAAYQTAILNYVYRLVGDADVAEDLTQETFIKAYRALERMDTDPEAEARRRAWLYRIAHNTAADHLRRRARLRWLPLESVRGRGGGDPAGEVARRAPIEAALAALSSEQREVLLLFTQLQMEAAEVAEVLGITPEAARKRRQRAKEAFEAAYAAYQASAEEGG